MSELRKILDERDARAFLPALARSAEPLRVWARRSGIDGRSLRAWKINLSRSTTALAKRPAAQLVELVPAPTAAIARRYTVRVGFGSVEVGDDFDPGAWPRLAPWVFPSLGDGPDDVMVTMPDEPAPRDDYERLHPSLAYYLVNDWLAAPEARAQLEAVTHELTGERAAVTPMRAAAIVAAFEDERLLLWGPVRAGVAEPAVFVEQPGRTDKHGPETTTTWIEIVLLDEHDVPIGFEAYQVTLPDGSMRSGALDERGFARVDGIERGVCDVTFPRIDGREWHPA